MWGYCPVCKFTRYDAQAAARIAALEEALRDAVAWNTKHTNCLLTGPDHTEHHPNIEAWTDALAYPNAQSVQQEDS